MFDPSGPVIGVAEARAKERATQLKATYVNARLSPWRYCEDCYHLLIFDQSVDIQESRIVM